MSRLASLSHLRVFVTGGTGFVGGHLVAQLIKRNARVYVLTRSVDPKSYFAISKLSTSVVMVDGDLKDYKRIYDIISKYEITTIFHLGAQPIVTTAYINPVETITSNVLGTTHILESARIVPSVQHVIIASSDKAYGRSSVPYKETDPLRGTHPYEVSKSATDLIAQAYHKTYGVPVVITRFGNIYGPGDMNPSRIVPGILQAALQSETLIIRSDGTFVRDYVYVEDVVRAYLYLLDHFDDIQGEAFNIASSQVIRVLDLVKLVSKVVKKKIKFTIANTVKNEIPNQELNWEKIRKLGWKPRYSLRDGVALTWKWYKKHAIRI